MIQALEITSVVMGLIQSVLVMFNKRANWIFYCLQMAAMALFSYLSKLYGDVLNSTFYFFLGVYAFFKWGHGKTRYIQRNTLRKVILYSIATAFLSIIIYCVLLETSDPLPLLDTLTTTTSLLATLLMVFRSVECWIVWFVNDILYILEYYMLPNQAPYLLALNGLWGIMAVLSYIKWKKL